MTQWTWSSLQNHRRKCFRCESRLLFGQDDPLQLLIRTLMRQLLLLPAPLPKLVWASARREGALRRRCWQNEWRRRMVAVVRRRKWQASWQASWRRRSLKNRCEEFLRRDNTLRIQKRTEMILRFKKKKQNCIQNRAIYQMISSKTWWNNLENANG